ncbi:MULTISPECIES: hypothetical protein [unclassified Coleofasciculus]|uniref:hypothetical protein n=1 Tax=unclassified Coleofasciculus TaxID=2692782 RepID=UPI00188168CD|nr:MULTISPECIES: hypothetical protein [unclassified Coleofasciculus]MBE9129497.1 hypothetical protein [Coleofasciculus sp. LEGE 07081]MBE9152089.1 hypothetical protein [Coleofasciculus sp. LEGE 07092]
MSRPPNTKQFLLVYFGLLFGTVILAILGERYFKLNGRCLIFLLCGPIFLAAAWKTPESFYQVIRSLGWFRLIEDESVMAVILFCLGVILVLIGLPCLLAG